MVSTAHLKFHILRIEDQKVRENDSSCDTAIKCYIGRERGQGSQFMVVTQSTTFISGCGFLFSQHILLISDVLQLIDVLFFQYIYLVTNQIFSHND